MLSVFANVLSLVLKPLLDFSKDLILNKVQSAKKVPRTLLNLLDHLEAIEYLSTKLMKGTQEYISKDWIAWTVARNKRDELVSCANELKKETIAFGESLSSLYALLDIYDWKLLGQLIGLYSVKAGLFAHPIAIPEIANLSQGPKIGKLLLTIPKSDDSVSQYIEANINKRFAQDGEIPKENYLSKIDIDSNKDQVTELLKQSEEVVSQIHRLKDGVREFIRANVSIDDLVR